jgi:hypothetical protein
VMTVASEASDPVCCFTFAVIAYCHICIIGFQVKALTKSCVSCVFVVMVRVHTGEHHSRPANTPRQAESKVIKMPGSCLYRHDGVVRVRERPEADSLYHSYRGGDGTPGRQAV